jgi:hypothetical protein
LVALAYGGPIFKIWGMDPGGAAWAIGFFSSATFLKRRDEYLYIKSIRGLRLAVLTIFSCLLPLIAGHFIVNSRCVPATHEIGSSGPVIETPVDTYLYRENLGNLSQLTEDEIDNVGEITGSVRDLWHDLGNLSALTRDP